MTMTVDQYCIDLLNSTRISIGSDGSIIFKDYDEYVLMAYYINKNWNILTFYIDRNIAIILSERYSVNIEYILNIIIKAFNISDCVDKSVYSHDDISVDNSYRTFRGDNCPLGNLNWRNKNKALTLNRAEEYAIYLFKALTKRAIIEISNDDSITFIEASKNIIIGYDDGKGTLYIYENFTTQMNSNSNLTDDDIKDVIHFEYYKNLKRKITPVIVEDVSAFIPNNLCSLQSAK